jgi:diketogulonate reductase-like aldo/keto reductase
MLQKRLKDGFLMPALSLGTWTIGGGSAPDRSRDREDIMALKTALSLGYSHIDTAEYYGGGHTEELIGKAIKGLDREKLFITTKVWPSHFRYDDVIAACHGSLKRMGIEYIDLYLLHWPNPDIPIEETMKAMNFLADKRLIRGIGVSNFSVAELKDAQKRSKRKIVANQIEYNIWNTGNDSAMVRYCQMKDIIVMAYKPLGRGMVGQEDKEIARLSAKYGKSPAQVVINWLVNKKNFVPVFKASKPEHLRENMDVFDFELTRSEGKDLDALVH